MGASLFSFVELLAGRLLPKKIASDFRPASHGPLGQYRPHQIRFTWPRKLPQPASCSAANSTLTRSLVDIRSLIAIPVISERRAHGVDGNCRYQSRGKEPEKGNSDRKRARQRLLRDEITVTNGEAGDESEIDRIPERPALNKTSQQPQGKLNCQDCRHHRPRHVNGMAERREKAPPQRFRCRPVHVVTTSVRGALQKWCSSTTDRGKKNWAKIFKPEQGGAKLTARTLRIAANPSGRLGQPGRTSHLDLHCGVERPPGRPQLRGKRRAELALKAPHQGLAHCVIMRWPNPKSGVLAT